MKLSEIASRIPTGFAGYAIDSSRDIYAYCERPTFSERGWWYPTPEDGGTMAYIGKLDKDEVVDFANSWAELGKTTDSTPVAPETQKPTLEQKIFQLESKVKQLEDQLENLRETVYKLPDVKL